MKKTIIILTLILLRHISFGQSNDHLLFGIDLSSDWYSLTNYQKLSYFIKDNDLADDVPFVFSDFDYSHDKVNRSFLDINYDDLFLGFPRGMIDELSNLQPELFLAIKRYSDIQNYGNNSKTDISKTKYLLIQKFGKPKLTSISEKYSLFQWNGVNYRIELTCKEDELSTTLIYIKTDQSNSKP